MKIKEILVVFLLIKWPVTSYSASSPIQTDSYLTGYVQGIFVHNYGLPTDAVTVVNGIIFIKEEKLGNSNSGQVVEKVKQVTANLKGVKGVKLDNKPIDVSSSVSKGKACETINVEEYTHIAMPNQSLFQPLIADPKWPRFTVAYQYYFKDKMLKHAFAPNFGASFPLYRRVNNETNSEWELGYKQDYLELWILEKNKAL